MSDAIVSGASFFECAPRAPITPDRWAGTPAKLARMDRLCALALVAADGALLDAGLSPQAPEWNGERTAVVLGTAYGCHATNEEFYRGLLAGGASGASPRLFAYTLPSSPVGEISIHYAIRGPATAVAPGLTAGLAALGSGLRELHSGRADRVLVVAAEVATPLLQELVGNGQTIPLKDGAAALVLDRAGSATARGRLVATRSAFAANDGAAAVHEATHQLLTAAAVPPSAINRVLGDPAAASALRPLGVDAPVDPAASATLGAAPLLAVTRFLESGAGLALAVAADPEGNGAAALLAADPR